jgi:hypothetical protein
MRVILDEESPGCVLSWTIWLGCCCIQSTQNPVAQTVDNYVTSQFSVLIYPCLAETPRPWLCNSDAIMFVCICTGKYVHLCNFSYAGQDSRNYSYTGRTPGAPPSPQHVGGHHRDHQHRINDKKHTKTRLRFARQTPTPGPSTNATHKTAEEAPPACTQSIPIHSTLDAAKQEQKAESKKEAKEDKKTKKKKRRKKKKNHTSDPSPRCKKGNTIHPRNLRPYKTEKRKQAQTARASSNRPVE